MRRTGPIETGHSVRLVPTMTAHRVWLPSSERRPNRRPLSFLSPLRTTGLRHTVEAVRRAAPDGQAVRQRSTVVLRCLQNHIASRRAVLRGCTHNRFAPPPPPPLLVAVSVRSELTSSRFVAVSAWRAVPRRQRDRDGPCRVAAMSARGTSTAECRCFTHRRQPSPPSQQQLAVNNGTRPALVRHPCGTRREPF